MLLGIAADSKVATASATFRLGVALYGLSPILMATSVLPRTVGTVLSTSMYVDDLHLGS